MFLSYNKSILYIIYIYAQKAKVFILLVLDKTCKKMLFL